MKRIVIPLVLVSLLVAAFLLLSNNTKPESMIGQSPESETSQPDTDRVTVLAQNLDVPWALAFLPNGDLLITERKGTVKLLQKDAGEATTIHEITDVLEISEGGLLGITIHPEFAQNNYLYVYYTYQANGNATRNRVVRYTLTDNTLQDRTIILDAIPGASNHDGGRLKFGPDNYLYIGTGDAQEPSLAQNTRSLAGKILRVTDDGKPAPGNPFQNEVYSYGHRNVQGLAWDTNGQLWATEHGRSGIRSGFDEVNRIEAGKNYGWPESEGDTVKSETIGPVRHSTASDTWAPSGASFVGSSLFFSGLRGQALYEAVIENNQVVDFREHFKSEFGRIREVVTGPEGMLYITTSNLDGRGSPVNDDDKIIRVNPTKL